MSRGLWGCGPVPTALTSLGCDGSGLPYPLLHTSPDPVSPAHTVPAAFSLPPSPAEPLPSSSRPYWEHHPNIDGVERPAMSTGGG